MTSAVADDPLVPSYSAESARRGRAPATAPIRVLHIINGEHFAGAERVQDLLALRLPEFGVEPAFACLKPQEFPAARRSQDTPLHLTPMTGRFDLRPAWRLAKLIRREQYDLIHTHTPRAALVGGLASRLAGVPMVHHVHGQTATEVSHRLRWRMVAGVERFAISRAAAVIAVSPSAGRYIAAHGVPEDKVRVVPNGVPAVGPLPPRPTPHGTWTIGVIALFRPRKGLETLIEALAALRHCGMPVRLRAIGSFETAEYEQTVRRYAERLEVMDAIEWTGFRTNVSHELAKLDLLAFPSVLAEGLPMVVLEAMAAGAPVVGTRVDGVRDAIRDGIDGLLCEPGDATELSEAIGRVIRGAVDWQTLRTAAWQRQRDEFSDHSMCRAMGEVYTGVLAPLRDARFSPSRRSENESSLRPLRSLRYLQI
jgi:glycosyltransferase involved in cell wall biosynthesis